MNIEIQVKVPTNEEYQDIMSCLDQYSQLNHPKEFQSIMVIYADAARRLFDVDIQDGQYHIIKKRECNFGSKIILEYAQKIWNKGLVPIEITRTNGSLFYAITQKVFFEKKIEEGFMMYVGERIPELGEFY